jgi:hypothetical protein
VVGVVISEYLKAVLEARARHGFSELLLGRRPTTQHDIESKQSSDTGYFFFKNNSALIFFNFCHCLV